MTDLGPYIAVIEKEPETDFGVFFPDLLGCTSAGKTLKEARDRAPEALTLHLEGMLQDNDSIPTPRPLSEIVQVLEREEEGLSYIVEMVNIFPEMAEAAE